MSENLPEGPSGPRPNAEPKTGDKRRWTPAMYERRRAVTACQPCRMRKTKCDNQRPICGFCQASKGRCVYTDKATDHSAFDPASLAILERVNHAVSMLESGLYAPPRSLVSSSPSALSSAPTGFAGFPRDGSASSQNDAMLLQTPTAIGSKLSDLPELSALVMSAESVLKWPIFQDVAPAVESFVLDSMDLDDQPSAGVADPTRPGPRAGRGVCEEDFVALSRRFLAYVHVKNPILDLEEYKSYVSIAAEHGPGWDGPSCIVLITCALANLAAPLEPETFASEHGSPETVRTPASCHIDRDAATSYFIAAQKRLGFLKPSLMYIQCLFLFGVFQMYSINALEAWSYFNQACVQFRSLLWLRSKKAQNSLEPPARDTRRLEQRLYWSCLKSEQEFQCEIPVPPSGLSSFDYPDPFPSPPEQVASPARQSADMSAFSGGTELDEERSWFYYLAEISSRRMHNHAIAIVGSDGEQGWTQSIQTYIRHARTLLEQLDLWFSHIPGPVNILNRDASDNELAHLIWHRGMACREWLHRPFIYYVIHQPRTDLHMEEVLPLAKSGLQICADLILSCSPRHKHRHHGTWYMVRSSMTRAVVLLAAVKCGKSILPKDWRAAVIKAMAILEAWGEEAQDLHKAGQVLRQLASDLCPGMGEGST